LLRLWVRRRRRIVRIDDVDGFHRATDSRDSPDANRDEGSDLFSADAPCSLEGFTRSADVHLLERDFIERGWVETEEELFELEE
jgi:hypothetical protein